MNERVTISTIGFVVRPISSLTHEHIVSAGVENLKLNYIMTGVSLSVFRRTTTLRDSLTFAK